MENTFLSHHGIKGQRWGVRRFQNEDGSLTRAGIRREQQGIKTILRKEQSERVQSLHITNHTLRKATARSMQGQDTYEKAQLFTRSLRKSNRIVNRAGRYQKDNPSLTNKKALRKSKMYNIKVGTAAVTAYIAIQGALAYKNMPKNYNYNVVQSYSATPITKLIPLPS